MKSQKLVRPAVFFLLSFGLTLAVLASVRQGKLVPLPPVEEPAGAGELDSGEFSVAAEAFRQGDFQTARDELERLATDGALEPRVILGLYAHASERHALALEELRAAEAYRGELADWRLWALAETAESLGQSALSRAVLWSLIEQHPGSPLRSQAAVLLATQAADRGDWPGVITVSRSTYDSRLGTEAREELARLSWLAAEALGDPEIRRSAARTILVNHPLLAPQVGAVELFREPEGDVPWAEFLSTAELLARSESLLAVDLPESAIDTLDQIADSERDITWHLLLARSLTEAQRGEEALAALDQVAGSTPEETNEIAWQRAKASIEISTPRRGRGHITADRRRQMREQAHSYLRQVIEGPDEALAVDALRILFADLFEDDRFEEALATLEHLQQFDPLDTTGARTLWGRGWKEYTERNYSGAIGYWSELGELYPRTNYNRSGLYWSARGHEKLGNRERSQELYRQVADVDVTDFYRRHALQRLEGGVAAESEYEAPPSEPWPVDRRLSRAETLYRLGLDKAALLEIDANIEGTEHRAAHALKARVLAAHGERRQSIIALRQAFPLLGTPHQSLAPLEARRLYYPLDFRDVIEKHSRSRQIPSHLVFGMIRQESAFDTTAHSWAGALGLMQIMPSTGRELARRLGLEYSRERLADPGFSVQLGTSYFQQVLKMFSGEEVLALAGYNAGPYRIKRLWREAGSHAEMDQFLEQLSYSETREYVKRVLLYSDSYRRLYGFTS